MINPCIDCRERFSGCLTRCELPEHISYEARQVIKRDMIRAAKYEQSEAKEYRTDTITRLLHKRI